MDWSDELPAAVRRNAEDAKEGKAFPRLLCPPMSGQGWLYCCREGCAWWSADHRECGVLSIARRLR